MIDIGDYRDCPGVVLNTAFPTLNGYIEAERRNKYAGAKIKKDMTDKIAWLAREQKFRLEKGLYDVIFVWYKPDNRTDHDNICFGKKFCLDGLVTGGAIEKDTPKFINNFCDVFVLDRTRKYISCKMIFVKVG